MSVDVGSCVRCDAGNRPLRPTQRWGRICPACWELYQADFPPRSLAERVGVALVIAGLALWLAFLVLAAMNAVR